MENEYDPFDVGGPDYVPDTPGYQASKGTAASQLGYTSDQVYGGGGGEGDDNNQYIARPGAGLTKTQFEKTYGITNRNPFGNRPMSGIGKFFDKLNRALGGKGIDYSQQFRDLDRLHNRRPGTSAARFRQRQYDLYRNPEIAADGRITSGGIDREGRGTFQGPVEEIDREMGAGEQLLRAGLGSVPFAGPFLSGLGTDGDLYLSSRVTPEMRQIRNQSLGSQLIEDLNLSDTIGSARDKVEKGLTSLGDRLQGILTGQGQQPAQAVIPSVPAMGSRDPSREIGPLAQTIPAGLTNQDEVAAMAMLPAEMIPAEMIPAEGMPAESDPRLSDNTTAEMLRESRVVDVPTPIGRRFDSPVTEIDTVTSRPMDEIETVTGPTPEEIDTISFQSLFPSEVLDSIAAKPPELVNAPNVGFERPRNAPNVGMSPSKPEDTFTVQDLFPELRNAPNLGFERDFGPRTPDDLRAIGIEPSVQDLIDMGLSPAEILQENLKRSEPQASTGQAQVAELDLPSLADLLNSGLLQDILTEQGPRTSVPLGGGSLNIRVNPNNPGIEFRKQLQDKDLGLGELLSFLNRRT